MYTLYTLYTPIMYTLLPIMYTPIMYYVYITLQGKRICRPTELCMKGEAMLHARHPFGTTSDILLTPPPFRFLLRLPLFDPIDSGVLPPAPNSGYY